MRRTWQRMALAVAGSAGLLSAWGCIFAADALSPDVAAFLGLDASPRQGSIIVQWVNNTDFAAEFRVRWSTSSSNPTAFTDGQGSNIVSAGDSANAVIDCPITSLLPTGLTAGESATDGQAAASVFGVSDTDTGGDPTEPPQDEQIIDVVFTGGLLLSELDFECGDVIEIRLIEVATTGTDAERFRIVVRRVPGR